MGDRRPEVVQRRVHYDRLFQRPYFEIRPKYRTVGFSNPVIRIVDIRDEGAAP